jgi:hypothetical protein
VGLSYMHTFGMALFDTRFCHPKDALSSFVSRNKCFDTYVILSTYVC